MMIIQFQSSHHFLHLELGVVLFDVYSFECASSHQTPFHELGILGQDDPILGKSSLNHCPIVLFAE